MSAIKVIFVDVKDTLGYIESPGKLVTFKPTTERLLKTLKETLALRIGIITNLPSSVSAEKGREMLNEAGITELIDEELLIINHDVNLDKPGSEIYLKAAEIAGVDVSECMFMGENLIEILGAEAAGMKGVLKPYPPGREFKLKPKRAVPGGPEDSGRLAELIMEEDHIIGKRIVVAAVKIVGMMKQGNIPHRAMRLLTYLLDHFIDKYHHAKEEQVLFPLAIAAGVDRNVMALVSKDHDQGRAYFRGMNLALERYDLGHQAALEDYRINCEGFIELYKVHGALEDDVVLPEIGKYLTDLDDAIINDLYMKIGPEDLTPFLMIIANMEKLLN